MPRYVDPIAGAIMAALDEQIAKDLERLYHEVCSQVERYGAHAARLVGLALGGFHRSIR